MCFVYWYTVIASEMHFFKAIVEWRIAILFKSENMNYSGENL